MKEVIVIDASHWPHALQARLMANGEEKNSRFIPALDQHGDLWRDLCISFAVKSSSPCLLVWPLHLCHIEHKAWPFLSSPDEQAKIIETYAQHDQDGSSSRPFLLHIFQKRSTSLWQILWPFEEDFRAVLAALGLTERRIHLISSLACVNLEAMEEGSLYQLDAIEGKVFGQKLGQQILCWPYQLDARTEKGRESIDGMFELLGRMPPVEDAQDVLYLPLADAWEALQGRNASCHFRMRKAGISFLNTCSRPLLSLAAIALLLPLILVAVFHGLTPRNPELMLSEQSSTTIVEDSIPSFEDGSYTKTFQALTSNNYPGIVFTERLADQREVTIRGRANSMEGLVEMVHALEQQPVFEGLILAEASRLEGQEDFDFVLRSPYKEVEK